MEAPQTPELQEIRHLRKRYNLTQSQLAKLAGVSQSLIAKIEAGTVDPTFSHAKRILESLHGLSREREPKAEQLITSKIISVPKNEPLYWAIRKMKSHGISQMPVTWGGSIVGMISESSIIEKMAEGASPARIQAKDAMDEAPPVIVKTTPLVAVTELLRHSPLVVVAENGKPKGVITKADILRKLM
ncbi:TPA: CBS domain-containing protein [Candidatus Woesearchaeota archaeon]|nr:CBS domain-containing protein [Candidatus Woesearchaeota archaeon]